MNRYTPPPYWCLRSRIRSTASFTIAAHDAAHISLVYDCYCELCESGGIEPLPFDAFGLLLTQVPAGLV